MIFIDTSALYALLDRDDPNHWPARVTWKQILSGGQTFLTHNYVLLETVTQVQRRLGTEAVAALQEAILPPVLLFWVDEVLHQRAMAAWLAAPRPGESLVDRISVEVIRLRHCQAAFTFDKALGAAAGVSVAPLPASEGGPWPWWKPRRRMPS